MKRKTLFIEVDGDPAEFFARPEVLDVIRDYASLGFLVTPIDGGPDAERLIREATGATPTRPIIFTGDFDPKRVWDHARKYSIDLAYCVLAATRGARDGVLLTAGVNRLVRLRRRAIA